MPTYEYECEACGHKFERFHSITAAPIRKCPNCGKVKVKRLISTGAGMIFKGSGFYITDYRDSKYSEQAKADNGVTQTKADGASESKPETKPETKQTDQPRDATTKSSEPSPPPAKSEPKPSKTEKPEKPDKSSRKK